MMAVPKSHTVRAPAFLAWLREQPCVVCHAQPCDPAHVRTRRNHGDVENAVPLCRVHHREHHNRGRYSFPAKYGLDLAALARDHWARWLYHWKMWQW